MRIVITEFITLDGVIEDPHKWSFPFWNDETEKFKGDELFASDAHLIGRITYEGFAAAWPSRTGDFADRMNNLPKYVVSTTLEKADWNNSHVIRKNVAEEISKIKQKPGRDILVHGSATLAETLRQNNLVDEYHLLVYPIVLGTGKRLFKQPDRSDLKLVESKSFGTGVVMLRYQPS